MADHRGERILCETTTAVLGDGSSSLTQTLPAGVYKIDAFVSGFFASDTVSAIQAVFDPTHFATGGGWVLTTTWPPAPASATVPGGRKANFGFNVKYKSDNVTPTGSLLFHLKEANVDLKAPSFAWLVITAGQKVEYEGTATINGSGNFSFRVIAQTSGSFEIHIWNPAKNGALDPTKPATFDNPKFLISNNLGGGNIVVH